MSSGRHAGRATTVPWLGVTKTAGKVIATIVSMLLIVGFWYGWKNYRDLDSGLRRVTGVDELGAGPAVAGQSAAPDIDGTAQNILVLGNDDRDDMTDEEVHKLHTGRDGGSKNTDTMLIVHVPADGSKATLISLPRDSYVDIPGFRKNKLNAAYPDGYFYNAPDGATAEQRRAAGVNQLIKTIRLLTGLQIDHFIQVTLLGFYRIADAIGPITVNLCNAVDDTNSGLHLPAGTNKLTAVQSLAFVRQRYGVPGSDLGREKRQRYFLTAAYRKIASLDTLINPAKLSNLIDAVDNSIYVDEGLSLKDLATQMANLSADNINGQNIPYVEETIVDGVGDVLIVDPAKVKKFVRNLINPKPKQPHSSNASPSSVPSTSSAPTSSNRAPIDSGCIN